MTEHQLVIFAATDDDDPPIQLNRKEGAIALICPLCKTVCEPKIVYSDTRIESEGGTALTLHAQIGVCVHGHECPDGATVLTDIRHCMEEGIVDLPDED